MLFVAKTFTRSLALKQYIFIMIDLLTPGLLSRPTLVTHTPQHKHTYWQTHTYTCIIHIQQTYHYTLSKLHTSHGVAVPSITHDAISPWALDHSYFLIPSYSRSHPMMMPHRIYVDSSMSTYMLRLDVCVCFVCVEYHHLTKADVVLTYSIRHLSALD